MAKHKAAPSAKKKPHTTPPPAAAASTIAGVRKDGIRETVESVVIAFVLAFLFRTFEAEAFVIPTGSMAPTLLGANKDVFCPECGMEYTAGASEEQDENWLEVVASIKAKLRDPHLSKSDRERFERELRSKDVVRCVCPNCRFTLDVDPDTADGEKYPTYKGDRILVAKFPYQFTNPKRWDVAVFKYPETANQNYIKRIVGLPNESIVIYRGDIFTEETDGSLKIQQKPPEKVLAMKQVVYDNDHQSRYQQKVGWPARWQPLDADAGKWQPDDDGRAFATDPAGPGEQWLAYRHTPPTARDWAMIQQDQPLTDQQLGGIKPQLIGDFYAYDESEMRSNPRRSDNGVHWVGDLVVECELQIDKPAGQVVLRLVKGGRFFDCTIDPATGAATLSIPGLEAFRPTAQTPIVGAGTYRVAFANVDNQLFLWVNRSMLNRGEIKFDASTSYDDLDNHVPTPEDLAAVRIGARGLQLRVSHLRVFRDLYYIAIEPGGVMVDYLQGWPPGGANDESIAAFLSDPQRWGAFEHMHQRRPLVLGEDQFLALGDNSPQSKDSRLWTGLDENQETEYYVKRDLLTGKALFVYWPHSWNKIIGTNIPCPFFPNFAQMRLVR
jgi:signal peptidase I